MKLSLWNSLAFSIWNIFLSYLMKFVSFPRREFSEQTFNHDFKGNMRRFDFEARVILARVLIVNDFFERCESEPLKHFLGEERCGIGPEQLWKKTGFSEAS